VKKLFLKTAKALGVIACLVIIALGFGAFTLAGGFDIIDEWIGRIPAEGIYLIVESNEESVTLAPYLDKIGDKVVQFDLGDLYDTNEEKALTTEDLVRGSFLLVSRSRTQDTRIYWTAKGLHEAIEQYKSHIE
jgi:hypothetical protein